MLSATESSIILDTLMIKKKSPYRIDLVGGLLDVGCLPQVLGGVKVINAAIDSYLEVTLTPREDENLVIESEHLGFFQHPLAQMPQILTREHPYALITHIVAFFNLTQGVTLSFKSDIRPGSGLGGSSVLAMTLFEVLRGYQKRSFTPEQKIRIVKNIENFILNTPTGFQDYFTALAPGVQCIEEGVQGISALQLASSWVAETFAREVLLVDSQIKHHSGQCNWSIYQRYFNGDAQVISALKELQEISQKTFSLLKNQQPFLEEIKRDARLRRENFPGYFPANCLPWVQELNDLFQSEIKFCGAGGGGYFLIIHPPQERENILSWLAQKNLRAHSFRIVM